jgi:hypothetical protein
LYLHIRIWGRPRLAIKADIASGGDSRGTGSLGTFYPLFPKNNYFNEANIQTPMNYMDLYPYVKIQPRIDLALIGRSDILWRQKTNDSFYQPPGVPIIPSNANSQQFLGVALNLQAEWQATPNLNLNVAVVLFLRKASSAPPVLKTQPGRDSGRPSISELYS